VNASANTIRNIRNFLMISSYNDFFDFWGIGQ